MGRIRYWMVAVLIPVLLAGCFGTQIRPALLEKSISLKAGDLEAHGLAFITPSTATTQEEEKQALALIFADVLARERPQVRVVSLAETLSAINKNNLGNAYKTMYDDYRFTGLFKEDILLKVGTATSARYLAQIKLQGFGQGAKGRWSTLGLRIVETQFANVRLFLQIWDSRNGSIAWEGMQELFWAVDRVQEQPVTMQTIINRSAQDLIARLP